VKESREGPTGLRQTFIFGGGFSGSEFPGSEASDDSETLVLLGPNDSPRAPNDSPRAPGDSPRAPKIEHPPAGDVRLLFRLQLFEGGWGLYPEIRHVSARGIVGNRVPGPFSKSLARLDGARSERNALGFMQQSQRRPGLRDIRNEYRFPDRAPAGYVFKQLRHADIYASTKFRGRHKRHPRLVAFRLHVLLEGDNQYGLHLVLAGRRNLEVAVDASTRVLTIDAGTAFVYADGVLYEAEHSPPAALLDAFLGGEAPSGLPFGAVMKWLDRLPPGLADGVARDLSGALEPEIIRDLKGCRLRLLEKAGGRLEARCLFVYGVDHLEVPALPAVRTKLLRQEGSLYRIERDSGKEEPYLNAIQKADLHPLGNVLRLPSDVDPVRFLLRDLVRLEEQGIEIMGLETLRRFKIRRERPRISVAVQSGMDWFDLRVILDYDGLRAEWDEILGAIKRNAEYVSLSDGSLAPLDESLRQALGFLSATARQSPREDTLRLNRTQILAAEDIILLSDESRTDEAFDASLARLGSFSGLEATEPASQLKAALRPYQQAGLDWLGFLAEYGFGGILADDMGLGKTVQTLALLQLRKGSPSGTHLIVAPTSVVYNWQREVERFTPDLSVLDYTGTGRDGDPAVLGAHDLVLTSYAILRRDAVILSQVAYDFVILDESQHIKNPQSQTFKAAMSLQARHRLCLTGTPVENSTTELWSQMHFANPGGLGSLADFKERFVTPIEKDGHRVTAERLRRITSPFILRRRKEDVARDLPEKVEQVIYCEMEEEQRRLYEEWRDHFRAQLLDSIQAGGLEKSRMKVLAGLVKLRQICNHPRLVEPSYQGSSGKLDYLLETMEELREEGHKVLIFSQFVKMLDVIRAALDGQEVPYSYLDGRTRERQSVVDAFQKSSEARHFLISLRAGGVGLNLTAADHVIIVDPWWNPAVEMQAIDRTHRIGQERRVFALKLITRGTVEEKILELQERKRQLAENVIATDESFMKTLSIEDIEAFFGKAQQRVTE
jgi:SNF2 family DNA or RNA helicase